MSLAFAFFSSYLVFGLRWSATEGSIRVGMCEQPQRSDERVFYVSRPVEVRAVRATDFGKTKRRILFLCPSLLCAEWNV